MDRGVEVRELIKTFTLARWQGFRRTLRKVAAVNGISLNIPAGQAVAFIGPNGAGKSTTIKMLTGILHPTSGEISVAGYIPWRDRRALAYHIGTVFGQRSQLWYHLPPADTFELLARIYKLDRLAYCKTRDALVDRFDLAPFMDVPVRKLSLGQRMRAEVAASLLHRPQIVFLDEPTIGLDVVARQQLRDLIREWNREQGTTIFLTSHDTGDIEQVAGRVVVINRGHVMVDDSVTAVRNRYLRAKNLRVQFVPSPGDFAQPGVTVVSRQGFEIRLRVDTASIPIQQVIANVLGSAPVADIAVEDPPLEEVISCIYAQTGGSS